MINDIKVSVLVATRNRADHLFQLLDGLSGQIDPPTFEVIIGDNNSTDHTLGIIENAKDRLKIRSLTEKKPGKGFTLNALMQLARGEIIVLTDDDVKPQRDWLSQLYAAAQRYLDIDIFGGCINVNMEEVPNWIMKSFNLIGILTSAHDKGQKDVPYGYGEYPYGPNMAIRRKLISEMVAPYPEHMGPGTILPIGDETCFLMKFSSPNSNNRMYIASARVLHKVQRKNFAFHSVLKRCFLGGFVSAYLGLPPTVQKNSEKEAIQVVTIQRLLSCRSVHELMCVCMRWLGYIRGNLQLRRVYNLKRYE